MSYDLAAIAAYNSAYAEYLTIAAATFGRISEGDCLNAHDWASGERDVRPAAGWPQAPKYVPTKQCHRCDGTGKTVFTWVLDGVCFRCNGTGQNPDWLDATDLPTGTCAMDVPVYYPDENQHMPEPCEAPTYGGETFCAAHATCECGRPTAHNGDCVPDFDNGALEEACRVCGTSPETHTTTFVDHAYQLGWRVRN